MVDQEKPVSYIPRLSRLPVRSVAPQLPQTQLPQTDQINGRLRTAPKSSLGPITVPRSRPKPEPPNASDQQRQRTKALGMSPLRPDPAKVVTTAASVEEQTVIAEEEVGPQPTTSTAIKPTPRKPRPSLSDRAIQTLSNIPPSPSPRRRQSGFFPTDSPAIRPPSALGRNRPVTSAGFYPPLPTARPTSPTKLPPLPSSRPSSSIKTQGTIRSSQISTATPSRPGERAEQALGRPLPIRRTTLAKDSRNEPKRSILKSTIESSPGDRRLKAPAGGLSSVRPPISKAPSKPLKSSIRSIMAEASKEEKQEAALFGTGSRLDHNSSAALREIIANARAARRAAPKHDADEVVKPVNRPLDGAQNEDEGDQHINTLHRRINDARSDGRLNISGMGLKVLPQEVLKMYELDTLTDGPTWYESVDLTRLNAADNQFEDMGWDQLGALTEDEKDGPRGNIFSSLQTLDLHGNRLNSLPSALRDLEQLTVLNLSRNRLKRSIADIAGTISNISSLRELNLAENSFSGPLPPFDECWNLEILDLHANAFTSLPKELSDCKSLRRLNVSGNKLSRLASLDLPSLTSLNLSSNQIAVDELITNLTAPELVDLDISTCRITNLPPLRSRFPKLTTIIASNNQVSTLNIEAVRGLEVLDLRDNDLRFLPPEISLLSGLKHFLVARNPMRAPRREILEGPTERLMEWLKGRLPADHDMNDDIECF
ncbi:MAG: hypothetical protein Q9201_005124 [Fulgogasparrea decipioides]